MSSLPPPPPRERGSYRVGTRASIELLLVPILVGVVGLGGATLAASTIPEVRAVAPDLFAWLTVALSALNLALIALVLRRNRLRFVDLGFSRPGWRLLHLLWQVPVMFILASILQALAVSLLELAPRESPFGTLLDASAVAAISALVATALLVPVWEEITFRGVVFGLGRRHLGVFWAIVIAAVAFALSHGALAELPYQLTIGLALGFIRWFHGTLWAAVIAHASLNTGITLLGLLNL